MLTKVRQAIEILTEFNLGLLTKGVLCAYFVRKNSHYEDVWS